MPVIECENVKKTYYQGTQEIQALDGISLVVEEGEFLALAGPSGSGKTTLLNIIGGLDRADEGRVVLNGTVLDGMSASQLSDLRLHKVGFVFQAFNLIPVLSALENVEFVMLLQGVPASRRLERARAILDEVGLRDMHGRRPAELSGGQQQRVAVARAIVGNPSIVLADEPTANLDSRTGARLLEIMKEMNVRRRATFVFSTHDRMVMEYASRLVRIQDGRIAHE